MKKVSFAIIALITLYVSAHADSLIVSTIYVTGTSRVPEAYVRSIIPLRENEEFLSPEDLERRCALVRIFIERTREYSGIDVFPEQETENGFSVFICLSENPVTTVSTRNKAATLFSHFSRPGVPLHSARCSVGRRHSKAFRLLRAVSRFPPRRRIPHPVRRSS